jgi:hypothetical protein
MDKPLVLCEVQGGIAFLTLNHPEKRNALSRALLAALQEQLGRVAADDRAPAVVLRAEGPAFSSGHDLREVVGGTRADYEVVFALCTEVMEAIRLLPKPVIAQVRGWTTSSPSRARGGSRRRMIWRRSRPARRGFAPAPACRGRTSPGHGPRAQRPALLPRRREADPRLLATVAEADERGMTLPSPTKSTRAAAFPARQPVPTKREDR